jgi:hypothetical protein
MKLKNLSFVLFPLFLLSAAFFAGCDDSGVVPKNPPAGSYPDIQFKPGAVYYFVTDTISQNGQYWGLRWLTTETIMASTTYQGRSCFPVNSVTRDTVLGVTIRSSTEYYSYSQSEGKFYQWGAKKLIDTTQAASWDLVADFTQPLGTEIALYTISNLFGQPTASANVKSRVVIDTVVVTIASGVTVHCYRVSLRAEIVVSTIVIGNAYIDYYIGYASSSTNPSGRVRTKFYPLNLAVVRVSGVDQRLHRFTIP